VILLLIHAGATLFMTGLIWFVQVVHYPLLANVGANGYGDYQARHERLTSRVVGPPMLIELVCAGWIAINPPSGLPLWMSYAGLALLAVVWLSTACLQVPRHHELEQGFNGKSHQSLVRTNWLRTIAWSLRSVLALWMLSHAMA